MKLETTKERILEAASKCSAAKETLKDLFPTAFEDDKYFDLSKLPNNNYYLFSNEDAKAAGFFNNELLQIRTLEEYANKAFYLDYRYNWELKRDSADQLVLIPTKK